VKNKGEEWGTAPPRFLVQKGKETEGAQPVHVRTLAAGEGVAPGERGETELTLGPLRGPLHHFSFAEKVSREEQKAKRHFSIWS